MSSMRCRVCVWGLTFAVRQAVEEEEEEEDEEEEENENEQEEGEETV